MCGNLDERGATRDGDSVTDSYHCSDCDGTYFRCARCARPVSYTHLRSTNEIVFTRGTTESINLLVASFGEEFMQEGDEVILSVDVYKRQ